ncbi:MAG: hypothetical protein ACRC10_02150 [Thermoguttaceae bacterium]
MTMYDWPKPIPGWDMLKWKDETQAAILRETEGMTDEEVREYFRKGSEEFQRDIAERRKRFEHNQNNIHVNCKEK